jgi:autotransporter-associated beta strand protein
MATSRFWLGALFCLFAAVSTRAADRTWDNGAANLTWDTTSLNWTGSAWSNAGDAAIFAGAGTGTISIPAAISLRSIDVTAGSYTLSGAGGLTIVSTGSGTLAPSTIRIATGNALTLNTGLTSSIGLFKDGGGTLNVNQPLTLTGTTPILGTSVNLQIGTTAGSQAVGSAGTVALTAAGVLSTSASVAIGAGYLNIGAFNTTIGSLTYMNTVASAAYAGPNGNNGVFGTGALRVTGAITVQGNLGVTGLSNTLAANLDMNGGTQQFVINTIPTGLGYTGLHVTGIVSNGNLLKTYTGPQPGGIALYGNNTYTGSTVINGSIGGTFTTQAFGNVVAGTNASTSLSVVNGFLTLYGTNGSYGSATTVAVSAGGTLSLDNNSLTTGTNGPAIAAFNNENRLNNAAAITLSHGTIQLLGQNGGATVEDVAGLNSSIGFNTVSTTLGTGTFVTSMIFNGNWTQGARAVTLFRGTNLGVGNAIDFTGTIPGEIGGLIPNAYGVNLTPAETGFVRFDGASGMVLITGYQAGFGAGGNVSIAASAGPLNTQTINALRSTATATVSFNAGQTLTVSSGMILATTGTLTIDTAGTPNGTVAFGAQPGRLIGGTGAIVVNSPITGTNGLIKSGTGTVTLNGSLAGLSGILTHHAGTTNLNANYPGNIDAIAGTLSLGASQTSTGTLTLGNPTVGTNLVSTPIGLNVQNVNVTQVAKNLVIQNGHTDVAFTTTSISQLGGTNGITQNFTGTVTLNSTLNILGGGNTTNVMQFSNSLIGAAPFRVQNGNIRFTGATTAYTGNFVLGNGGNTTLINFDGTFTNATGTVTIGPGTGVNSSTIVRVSAANAIPTGQIIMQGGTLQPSASFSFANQVSVTGNATIDVGTGLATGFAGAFTGSSNITKTGTGQATFTGASPAYAGTINVNAGIASVTGSLSAANVNVASGGRLQGSGTLTAPVNVAVGGTIKGGNSIGTLTVNAPVTLNSDTGTGATLLVEGTPITNSMISVTGATNTFNFANLTGTNKFSIVLDIPTLVEQDTYTYELIRTPNNANGILVNGVVATGQTIPTSNYTVTSGNFAFIVNTILVANADSVVLTFKPVPEPTTLLAVAGLAGLAIWRRRR